MTRIFAFHLLNDYSGSPKVLSQLLKGWVKASYEVHLQTSSSTPGFLTDIPGVHHHDNRYRFYQSVPLRLFALVFSQLFTLATLLFRVRKNDLVYVNTILPFGAAIAGWARGARVIYHIHETSVSPLVFKRFLMFWVRVCASEVVYVSNFLADEEPLRKPSHVLWNAIEDDFREKALAHCRPGGMRGNVLMLASLKQYKGVDEYVKIARGCPGFRFELVANASEKDIAEYFAGQALPDNLVIYPAQSDVHPFYQRADVVMNLSRPDEWKETFGLTALEAMAYGLPVIVPPVGGIAEIVKDCITGFHLDGKDTQAIVEVLQAFSNDPILYETLSTQAAGHAASFSAQRFLAQSLRMIGRSTSSRLGMAFHNLDYFTK